MAENSTTSEGSSTAAKDSESKLTLREIRKEHQKLIYLAPTTFALTLLLDHLRAEIEAGPWDVALLLLAIGIALVVGWMRLKGDPKIILSTRFLVLLLGYVLVFSIAAHSDLLSWKSRIQGFEEGVKHNFLALNRLGDWHYCFARPESTPGDLLVVAFEPASHCLVRQFSAELIQSAQVHGAIAVALDFHLPDPCPSVDQRFCRAVNAAKARTVPMRIVYGREHDSSGGSSHLRGPSASLPCLLREEGGHLLGILEWDGRLRVIPRLYDLSERWQALSWKVATALDPKLTPTEPSFIQFLEPKGGVDIRDYKEVEADPGLLTEKLVLAGFRQADLHWTPFGQIPGVMIHAYAAQNIRSGQLIRRVTWPTSFPVIFATCYVVFALWLRGGSQRRIVFLAAGMSVAIVAIAAAGMHWGLLWIDVSYPIASIWLFVALLYGGRLLRLRPQI